MKVKKLLQVTFLALALSVGGFAVAGSNAPQAHAAAVLRPSVLTPEVLRPGVLTPEVLRPGVLTPQ